MMISLDCYALFYLIKYFENGGWRKCLLWLKMIVYCLNILKFGTKIKTLKLQFQSIPVYDEKHIKAKAKEFKLMQTFGMIKYQKKVCITDV